MLWIGGGLETRRRPKRERSWTWQGLGAESAAWDQRHSLTGLDIFLQSALSSSSSITHECKDSCTCVHIYAHVGDKDRIISDPKRMKIPFPIMQIFPNLPLAPHLSSSFASFLLISPSLSLFSKSRCCREGRIHGSQSYMTYYSSRPLVDLRASSMPAGSTAKLWAHILLVLPARLSINKLSSQSVSYQSNIAVSPFTGPGTPSPPFILCSSKMTTKMDSAHSLHTASLVLSGLHVESWRSPTVTPAWSPISLQEPWLTSKPVKKMRQPCRRWCRKGRHAIFFSFKRKQWREEGGEFVLVK